MQWYQVKLHGPLWSYKGFFLKDAPDHPHVYQYTWLHAATPRGSWWKTGLDIRCKVGEIEKAVNDRRAFWGVKKPSTSGHWMLLLLVASSLSHWFLHDNKLVHYPCSFHLAMSCTSTCSNTLVRECMLFSHSVCPPALHCRLESDWLGWVWKSTSVELQGGRPLLAAPLPWLTGFQPRLTAQSTVVCKSGRGPLAVPTIYLLWPNFETCLRHRSLQHTAGHTLKVHVTHGKTYTKARFLLQVSPSTFTHSREPVVGWPSAK